MQIARNNVHTSTFFSVRKKDNKIIGSVKLHHFLTPEIENSGHIAYGIRPSERKKGYGIVCDKDNIASAKTALSCNGILTSEIIYEGVEQQHYLIDLC